MAFNAIDNTRVNAAKHPDDWYAAEVVAGKEIPYASLAAAYAAIPSAVRMKGRSFLITENGAAVEYWFKDDLTTAVIKNDGRSSVVYPWRYGLVGDGVTDDTVAFFNMLQAIPDSTTIDFGNLTYQFDFQSVNLVGKRFIKFIGNGATFKGTIIIGDKDPAAVVTTMNFTSKGIRFLHTGNTANCYELVNMRGFYIDETYASGSNALLYIRPLDKFQHVNRGSVKNSHGNCNYLVYADNPINTAPYTNIQMSLGDIEISGNADHVSKITNVLGFGVDGATITNNTFFMDGWNIKSQNKNQNIRLVASNWVTIVGNKLFESGLEGILMERSTDFVISGNTFAWSGERDVNFGWGIRITGRGYPDSGYMTSVISSNTFDRVTRSAIRLDELSQRVKVCDNQAMSIGNPSFYYGDGTFDAGNPNVVPSINSVTHYMVECHANTKYCSVHDNHGDNANYTFPFDATLGLGSEQMLTHYNNDGGLGIYENRIRTISTITDGVITTGATDTNDLNLPANTTITNILGMKNGEKVVFYNIAPTVVIENNANIQLANNENMNFGTLSTVSFQKRNGKLYETGRTQHYPEAVRNFKFTRPTALTTLQDAIVSPNPAFDIFTMASSRIGLRLSLAGNRAYKNVFSWDANGKIRTMNENNGVWGPDRLMEFAKLYTAISTNTTKATDFQSEVIVNTATALATLTLSYNNIAVTPTTYEIINPETAVANFIVIPNNVGTAMFIDGVSGAAGQVVLRPGEKVKLELINATNFITTYRGVIKVSNLKGGSRVLTGTTTLALSDYGSNGMLTLYADATGGAFTVTLLPSATDQGYSTKIVKTDASANTITVKGNGTELINNSNTDTTLSTQNSSFILESNGTKHFKF